MCAVSAPSRSTESRVVDSRSQRAHFGCASSPPQPSTPVSSAMEVGVLPKSFKKGSARHHEVGRSDAEHIGLMCDVI